MLVRRRRVSLTVVDTRRTFSRRRPRGGRDGSTHFVAHRILRVNVYVTCGVHIILCLFFVAKTYPFYDGFPGGELVVTSPFPADAPEQQRHGKINESRRFSSAVVVILHHDFVVTRNTTSIVTAVSTSQPSAVRPPFSLYTRATVYNL